MDIPTLFAVVLLGGLVIAILATKVILPWVGDWVATFFYSSGDRITSSPELRAASKVAQGDYSGAIAEHENTLAANPKDVMAVSEIAKLRAEKLDQPEEAIRFLTEAVEQGGWSAEDDAFLRFRLIDLLLVQGRQEEATGRLNEVAEKHAGTRHAANAHHRLNELRASSGTPSQAARK